RSLGNTSVTTNLGITTKYASRLKDNLQLWCRLSDFRAFPDRWGLPGSIA
ncbi:hypothetical protein ACSSVY_004053, partial [Roseovarius sp. MBR-51]